MCIGITKDKKKTTSIAKLILVPFVESAPENLVSGLLSLFI